MKLSWHKRLPRLRPLVGLFVIVASVIASLATPYAVSAASSYGYFDGSITTSGGCATAGGEWFRREGAPGTGDCQLQSNPQQNAETFLYAGYLADCLKLRNTWGVYNSSQISAFDITHDGDMDRAADFGFVTGDDDGKLQCSAGNARTAASALGYTDFLVLLDAIGCKPSADSGRNCSSIGNEAAIAKKLLSMRYGASPSLDGPAKYYYYHTTFVNACVASPLSNPTSADTNEANSNADTSKKYNLKDYNSTTKAIVDTIYSAEKDKGTAISPVSNGDLGAYGIGDSKRECRTLASMANQYADVYKRWADVHAAQATALSLTGTVGAGAKPKTSCAIDGVGWLVCPVMTFMANIIDKSYGIVSAMLTVNAFSTTNNAVMLNAWENMRNLANVAFIIAFLVVVYSQVTGAGISNYGLKRMLPRIIVAAILVNISFWLCALAVDLSNVVGASMRNVIEGAGGKDLSSVTIQSAGATGKGWVGIVGGILSATIIGAAALYVGLAALLPALISALFVIVTVLLVLTLRQALIILLVVVSPLAFVAYLLPNTNEWFTKWRKLFIALLMMYPIIGVLFGASSLASTIVQNGAAGGTGAGAEGIKVAVQIMGALIQILPLVLLPTLMKSSAGVLGKFAGMVNNPNKGPFDRMKKGAANVRERQEGRRTVRALNGGRSMGLGKYQRRAKKQAIDGGIKQSLSSAQNEYVAGQVTSNAGLANKVGGGTVFNAASQTNVARAQAAAIQVEFKAFDEHVSAEKALLSDRGINASAKGTIAPGSLDAMVRDTSLSAEQRSAAASRLIQTGADYNIHEMLDYLGTTSDTSATTIQKQVASDIGQRKPKSLGQADVSALATGTYGVVGGSSPADGQFDAKVLYRVQAGKQSGESLASAGPDELERIQKVLATAPKPATGTPEATSRAALIKSIDEYYTSAATSGRQVPNDIKSKMDLIKSTL